MLEQWRQFVERLRFSPKIKDKKILESEIALLQHHIDNGDISEKEAIELWIETVNDVLKARSELN